MRVSAAAPTAAVATPVAVAGGGAVPLLLPLSLLQFLCPLLLLPP